MLIGGAKYKKMKKKKKNAWTVTALCCSVLYSIKQAQLVLGTSWWTIHKQRIRSGGGPASQIWEDQIESKNFEGTKLKK